MDSGRTDNERELTSTMGNVLSVSIKDEKNDTSGSDATPTSSTDANTTTTSSRIGLYIAFVALNTLFHNFCFSVR